MPELLATPLHDAHVSMGARMVPFSGWDMPVQYKSILEEVDAVRTDVGAFDVSHMGRVFIHGPGAGAFLSRIFSTDARKIPLGRAKYGVTCNQEGGIIDDNILYRLADDHYLFIPNAGNRGAVEDWLHKWIPNDSSVQIDDASTRLAMIAVQGPSATRTLSKLTGDTLAKIRPFGIAYLDIDGAKALAARTGYTGEDGFEVMPSSEAVVSVWNSLIEVGATPCGLASRDLLRLEAGLLLHGNDMDTSVNPYEAGLDRFVDPDRPDYIPGRSLRSIRDTGPTRKLVGFEMVGRGIARHGHIIRDDEGQIGEVTSGSVSFTLDKNIGLGYVPIDFSEPGTKLYIDIRGRIVEAVVCPLPFYSRRSP